MIRVYIFYLLLIAGLFVLAGRLDYWQGWLFAAACIVLVIVISVLFADKKELLQERIHPGPGVKSWDKIFFSIYLVLFASVIVISTLDAGRFGWSVPLAAYVYVIAYVVLIVSYAGLIWAMWTNKFFSSRVRIQTDRGHYVIQDGPYRFVRHPGYLAAVFSFLALPLALGSLFGLIPAALVIISIIIRTILEDKTLQAELPGYSDYAQKVRYRLFPGVW